MRINPANLLCLFRAVLALVAAFFLLQIDGEIGKSLAVIAILVAMLADTVDGIIARAFGMTSKVGELSDLYADHILANAVWLSLLALGLVSPWVPLILSTRDLWVDWLRQAMYFSSQENGFEQVKKSSVGWLSSSPVMRSSYSALKICCWLVLILSVQLPLESAATYLVWLTVGFCLIRAIPTTLVGWGRVVYFKPVV